MLGIIFGGLSFIRRRSRCAGRLWLTEGKARCSNPDCTCGDKLLKALVSRAFFNYHPEREGCELNAALAVGPRAGSAIEVLAPGWKFGMHEKGSKADLTLGIDFIVTLPNHHRQSDREKREAPRTKRTLCGESLVMLMSGQNSFWGGRSVGRNVSRE